MAHSYHHAVSSARKFGGVPEDYTAVHSWLDRSKEIVADFRHRALRHHAEGIWLAGNDLWNHDRQQHRAPCAGPFDRRAACF